MQRTLRAVMCCNYPRWPQSFSQEPKTDHEFKDGHRCVEDVIVHDFVEVREDEENKSAEHAPDGLDYAKNRQSFRDVVRLEPQPCANSGGQSEERQAHIIVIEIR